MKDIQNILQELYMIDDSLREHEALLIPLIQELVKAKPDTKFNSAFAKQLKDDLMRKGDGIDHAKEAINHVKFLPWLHMPVLKGVFALTLILVLILGLSSYTLIRTDDISKINIIDRVINKVNDVDPRVISLVNSIDQFKSEQEYRQYIADSHIYGYGHNYDAGRGGGGIDEEVTITNIAEFKNLPSFELDNGVYRGGGEGDRVSQTNVQVLGIDEPDVVKTNGKELFYAGSQTNIIDISNPNDIELIEDINKQGEMILHNDTLIIFSGDEITGYDIDDADHPDEIWKLELKDSDYIVTSRLYNDVLYLVTNDQNYGTPKPCPIIPILHDGRGIIMPCTEILRPNTLLPNASTYHAFAINPDNGGVVKKISFIGSDQYSAMIYMSKDNLYVTYSKIASEIEVMLSFLSINDRLLPSDLRKRILSLADIDISDQAKSVELNNIIDIYIGSLNSDDQLKFDTEFRNKGQQYLDNHIRDLESTSIVKIDLKNFSVGELGTVPGKALNQFSMDEHNGNVRIATTVGEQWFGRLGLATQSANDVYVLNKDLDVIGSIQGLGLTEKIYSARFVGDMAYLITFRQTDPFYVLDLSDPRVPQMKGELKIPGFSSYLHPLSDDMILGVGSENGQVKLSLFDVSDPTKPKEKDKYILTNEYWTEVNDNHRAFLQDIENKVFFIPAGQNAHIFSYKGDKLDLEHSIADVYPRRAVYVKDSWFIIGSNEVISLRQGTWEKLDNIEIEKDIQYRLSPIPIPISTPFIKPI